MARIADKAPVLLRERSASPLRYARELTRTTVKNRLLWALAAAEALLLPAPSPYHRGS